MNNQSIKGRHCVCVRPNMASSQHLQDWNKTNSLFFISSHHWLCHSVCLPVRALIRSKKKIFLWCSSTRSALIFKGENEIVKVKFHFVVPHEPIWCGCSSAKAVERIWSLMEHYKDCCVYICHVNKRLDDNVCGMMHHKPLTCWLYNTFLSLLMLPVQSSLVSLSCKPALSHKYLRDIFKCSIICSLTERRLISHPRPLKWKFGCVVRVSG